MQIKNNKRPQAFPKVNQQMLDAILEDIRKGSPRKHAAEANGISRRHFHHLIAQGILDLEFGKIDTIHARLARSLRQIEQEEIQWCREKARFSEDGHKGAQWTLEHAYWRDFGKDANSKELAEEIEQLRDDLKKGALKNGIKCGQEKEDSEE